MRTLGLIGGCGAESSALYYARINRLVRARRPGHGARLLLWSFDVEDIDRYCRAGEWAEALLEFEAAARWLEMGGADAVLLCTNTMHRIADDLAQSLGGPLIHIIDETARVLRARGHFQPALLGTRYTMGEAFYRERLAAQGLKAQLPGSAEREAVHRVIYEELMQGQVSESGRAQLIAIVERLVAEGADSVILGCTELGLALSEGDVSVAVYDTAEIHCQAAVAFALG
jgi:aspartate racemase